MATFKAKPGLDAEVAQRFAVPAVRKAQSMLHDTARVNAPPVKVWVTMRDERVRRSHVDADGQEIPENLRFRLRKAAGAGVDLARAPRDPLLPVDNRIQCRCDAPVLPQPLKDSIKADEVLIEGPRVTGKVYTDYPRAAESEYGTGDDAPAHYFTDALREVAARLQSGHSR